MAGTAGTRQGLDVKDVIDARYAGDLDGRVVEYLLAARIMASPIPVTGQRSSLCFWQTLSSSARR
jgi:hypothetical protein